MLTKHWEGRGIQQMRDAVSKVDGKTGRTAYRRAVNHTGRKAFTVVKRAVSKQVGLSQARIVALGKLKKFLARGSNLDFVIHSSGQHLSLKEFKPHQTVKGTKASPWGTRRVFEGAFMGPRPGAVSASLGGHVFVRAGKARLPIKRLWGPAVPKEIVHDESATTFNNTVSANLPARFAHEVRVLTKGIIG